LLANALPLQTGWSAMIFSKKYFFLKAKAPLYKKNIKKSIQT
jgi:hypothetical protein